MIYIYIEFADDSLDSPPGGCKKKPKITNSDVKFLSFSNFSFRVFNLFWPYVNLNLKVDVLFMVKYFYWIRLTRMMESKMVMR